MKAKLIKESLNAEDDTNLDAIFTEFEKIWSEYNILKYRMGTNAERGLYPKLRSLRSKLNKAEEKVKEAGYKVREDSYGRIIFKKIK